jgi:hypothetical protein
MHAVNIFGAGLDPHQNHFTPVGLQFRGLVGREHDFAGGGARRCRQPGDDDIAGRGGIDGRMQ